MRPLMYDNGNGSALAKCPIPLFLRRELVSGPMDDYLAPICVIFLMFSSSRFMPGSLAEITPFEDMSYAC